MREISLTRREFNRNLLLGMTGIAGIPMLLGRSAAARETSRKIAADSEMELRRVGNQGLKMSGVSFCASDLSKTGWGPLGRAMQLGVNYIAASPQYDSSEEIIGKNLIGWRDRVTLSTTWSTDGTASADALVESFRKSSRLLKSDYIDIIITDDVTSREQLTCVGSREAFNRLKSEKRVGYRGFLNRSNQVQVLTDALALSGFDIVLLSYTINNYKELRAPLEKLRRRGLGIIAIDTLSASLENPSLARRLIGKREKSLTAATIKWILSENGIASVLIPIQTAQEAEECVQAVVEFQED